jgi:hypothetical protein
MYLVEVLVYAGFNWLRNCYFLGFNEHVDEPSASVKEGKGVSRPAE